MLKQFEGLKKKNYCVELKKTFYKHGERTTCIVEMAIPVPYWMHGAGKNVIKKFPNINAGWTEEAWDCYKFTIIGTCIPKDGDIYDEKKGETIAYSKCQRKAYSITARVLAMLSNELAKFSANYEKAAAFMAMACDREQRFIDSL